MKHVESPIDNMSDQSTESMISQVGQPDRESGQVSGFDPAFLYEGNLAMHARTSLLWKANLGWMISHGGSGQSELTVVSQAGFLPFWVKDPKNGGLIQIKTSADAVTGTSIAYLPDESGVWDFSSIPIGKIGDPDAEPSTYYSASDTYELWSHLAETGDNPDLENAVPEGVNEAIIWVLEQDLSTIMDSCAMALDKVPTNCEEFLHGRYVFNQDFLDKIIGLAEANELVDFQIGSNSDKDIVYLSYQLSGSEKMTRAWKYLFVEDGYDVTSLTRRLPAATDGLSGTAILDLEMILDYQNSLPSELYASTEQFYSE
jgi:hypothetical protein